MLIEANTVVSFHYRLSESGQELEDSHGGNAMVYLHGHRALIKGVEEALQGKQAGDHFSVTVPPEDAYGPRQENAIQRISINHVMGPKKNVRFKPGMVVQVNTKDGPREVVVVKAGLKSLDVDLNHPLAGKTLTFDIEVMDVRAATEEEIAHGHVHGEDDHQH